MSIQEPPEESFPPPFICACEEDVRQACAGEGGYKEKDGKLYCVLHYPGDEKLADFQTALNNKLSVKDYNFRGVCFPKGVRFKQLHLDGNTDFSYASFNDDIDFSSVEFSVTAPFNNASFNAGVDFSGAHFKAWADFGSATFSADAYFKSASFSADADFSSATFRADASFFRADFSAAGYFG
jgi:hypothetical protein